MSGHVNPTFAPLCLVTGPSPSGNTKISGGWLPVFLRGELGVGIMVFQENNRSRFQAVVCITHSKICFLKVLI